MTEKRRAEDITEPQTIDELVRATYRDMKSIKGALFDPETGISKRMVVLETIVSVLAWVVGIGIPALGVVVGWMVFFKKVTP